MFVLVTGKPGSGKSYYAVNYIYSNKDNYFSIECNINGIRFSDNVTALNFKRLYKIIEECKRIYDSQIASLGDGSQANVIDEPIIDYLLSIGFIEFNPKYDEYIKALDYRDNANPVISFFLNLFKPLKSEPKYKPSLFVIDEAQNHFSSIDRLTGKSAGVDPVLIWWIAYHRHLCMDVILLTQHYEKLQSSYLKDIEYFLDAVPASRIIGRSFKYNKYIKIPYYKTNLAETIKLPKKKEVFELYDSGDRIRSKNVVIPWIIFSLVLLVAVVSFFYYFVSSSFGSPDSTNEDIKKIDIGKPTYIHKPKVVSKPVHNIDNVAGLKYLSFVCYSGSCHNSDYAVNLSILDLDKLLKSTGSKFLRQKVVNKRLGIIEIFALVSDDFLDLFENSNQGVKDEILNVVK